MCNEGVPRGVCNEGCVTSQLVLLQRSVTRSVTNVRRGSVTDPSKKSLPFEWGLGCSLGVRFRFGPMAIWVLHSSLSTMREENGSMGKPIEQVEPFFPFVHPFKVNQKQRVPHLGHGHAVCKNLGASPSAAPAAALALPPAAAA